MSKSKTIAVTGATTLPLDQLRIDDATNVRKTGRGADRDFVANIKAIGIQQPLIVRPNGTGYLVADGGKRLAAAQELVKTGDLAPNAPIPVIVTNATDAEARELSLALNLIRANMHPVDAYRAFAALHSDKQKPLDVEALSTRFGVPAKIVTQRLALGALDDTVLDAWQSGKIREDAAQAFTLCPNKKDQARILAKLVKDGRVDRWTVKHALKIDQNNVGRFLNLIGVKAYEARGGKVMVDLFGSDHVVSDATLMKKMVGETLAATCKRLVEQGWSWAVSDMPDDRHYYGRLQGGKFNPTAEEQRKLDALQAQVEDESTDDNEAASDAYDALKETIIARSFSLKQKAMAGCFVGVSNDGALSIEYGRVKPAPAKKVAPAMTVFDRRTGQTIKKPAKTAGTLSQALVDRLREQRLKAIKAALVTHPHGNDFALLLAGIVAAQINPGSRYHAAPDAVQNRFDAIADGIAPKVMNAALRKAFDASDYFEAAPKVRTLTAITEAVNADESRKLAGKKRPEIAKFAVANVVKTGWLPKELRTSHYEGPQGKPAAKKKAAAKRKPAAKAKRKPAIKAKKKTAR